jgi:hypothetical protein
MSSKVEVVQYVNDFFTEENYHNAILDYLEGTAFPELLDTIEDEISSRQDGTLREQLHELLHSPEFETAFRTGWPEDIEGDFEEWDGTVEDFVAELEWSGL